MSSGPLARTDAPVTPLQFAVFRILLASVLAAQLVSWWPFSAELFASDGLPALGGPGVGALFPNVLPASVGRVQAFFVVLLALCLALGLGVARRTAAVGLWYGWSCLGHAAPHTLTVASAFIGWLLLATALVPTGEPLRPFGRARPAGGEVPRALWIGAWIVLAAGYGLAGADKLASPGWRGGEALASAVGLPYARELSAQLLLALPRSLQRAATWTGLAVELCFPLLAMFRRTRPIAWLSGALLQLALLGMFAFPGLTLGMLLMHAFAFDSRWLARAPARG